LKQKIIQVIIIIFSLLVGFCTPQKIVKENVQDHIFQPPVAKKIPTVQVINDYEYIDNYQWMIDNSRSDSSVIAYIEEENDYADYILAHMQSLKDTIFEEIISRIGEEYENAPTKWGNYYYYSRREEGKPYYIYCRKYKSLSAPEQVVLDVNKLAEGHEFFSIDDRVYSPDQKYLAYSVDLTGDERYTLYIKDIDADTLLNEAIYPVNDVDWANDNKTIFYVSPSEDNLKSKIAYRHVLGNDPAKDELLYKEEDNAFYVWFGKTRSEDYLILGTNSRTTSDVRYLDANDPMGDFTLIKPRVQEVKYYLSNHGDTLFIRTNQDALNYKIVTASLDDPQQWRTFIAPSDSVYIDGFDVFKNYLVVYEQHNGVIKPHIFNLKDENDYYISFPENIYSFTDRWNPNFATDTLYFTYSSMTTPSTVYAYNMRTRDRKIIKRYEVIGGYDRELGSVKNIV